MGGTSPKQNPLFNCTRSMPDVTPEEHTSFVLNHIAIWLKKHAFREYLAIPRTAGKAYPFPQFLQEKLKQWANKEIPYPGPNG